MFKLSFLPIIALVLFVLWLSNVAVSRSIASLFGNTSRTISFFINFGPLLLTCSFIVALFVGAKYYNLFTCVLYSVSASWMGVFFYLLLASVLYGFVVLLMRFTGSEISLRWFGVFLLTLALIVGIYGLFHARKIFIKRVDIKLEQLPVSWEGRTAVFVSDVHLGQIRGESFSRKIVDKINALNPDIVFIGGDLYDGFPTDIKRATEPFNDLKPKLGVYFITGNHEEFRDNKPFIDAVKEVGMRVLDDEKVEIEGVQILGVDYLNARDREKFAEIIVGMNLDKNKPSILLKHEPKDVDVTSAQKISLQLSGHTHRAQVWPLGYLPKKVYKGFDYDLKSLGDTQIFTSSGVGTWGPPIRVGTNAEIVFIKFN
jgi:predicted MPP superfamily phosphohydrolase